MITAAKLATGPTQKMDPAAKAGWLAALRSGRHVQVREVLRGWVRLDGDPDRPRIGMCCLGVLSEVFRQETGRGEWDEEAFVVDGVSALGDLHPAVTNWAGLFCQLGPALIPDQNPELTDEHGTTLSASEWNDDARASFAKIADMVEASL